MTDVKVEQASLGVRATPDNTADVQQVSLPVRGSGPRARVHQVSLVFRVSTQPRPVERVSVHHWER